LLGSFARKLDRVARVLEGGRALDEEHGPLGHALAALLGVLLVVEPDREDVRRHDGRQDLAGLDDVAGRPECAEEVARYLAADPSGCSAA
jgi:hypothetical protein